MDGTINDYEYTRKRVTKFYNNKNMSDREIIEVLSKEIEQYRERIKQLTRIVDNRHVLNMQGQTSSVTGSVVDYITETFYNDSKVVKEIIVHYK